MSIGERVIAMAAVYKILNTANGMSYIGYSKNWKKRKYEHFHSLKKNKHYNSTMQSDFNHYGRHSFKFILIKSNMDEKSAIALEYDLIQMGFGNIYNSVCAKGSGINHSHDTTAIPFTWNGVTYPSKLEASRQLEVSCTAISWRIEKGYVCDDDLYNGYNVTTWNGIEYPSMAEAARGSGFTDGLLKRFIEKGYTCDSDIKEGDTHFVSCEWNGIKYDTIKECAINNNISPKVMRQRLNRGYVCDSDIPHSKASIPFTWNGIKYKSMKYAAEQLGVSTQAIRYRRKKGYTCDGDFEKPSRSLQTR